MKLKRRGSERGLTVESIVADEPDEKSFLRHFMFCRFILRETTRESAMIARQAEGQIALTEQKMRHLVEHWSHDPDCDSCVFVGEEHKESE